VAVQTSLYDKRCRTGERTRVYGMECGWETGRICYITKYHFAM